MPGPRAAFTAVAILVLAFLAAGVPARAGEAADEDAFVVIVSRANPDTHMARHDVADLFLKRARKWDHGPEAMPVDLPPESAARAAFSRSVLGREIPAVLAYWRSQIFSGRGVPPAELATPELVADYVARNPGAVGYIPRAADGTLPAGVRALRVTN